jgi:hypothetical protein
LNAVEIEEAISQLADQVFDPENFPYSFLEAFGNKETTIKRLRYRRGSNGLRRVARRQQGNSDFISPPETPEVCITQMRPRKENV